MFKICFRKRKRNIKPVIKWVYDARFSELAPFFIEAYPIKPVIKGGQKIQGLEWWISERVSKLSYQRWLIRGSS